jgi:hypothetical protein
LERFGLSRVSIPNGDVVATGQQSQGHGSAHEADAQKGEAGFAMIGHHMSFPMKYEYTT